jgi:hypothetical protein
MAVLGFQNQNMSATDDADEFGKFDVKKTDPKRTQGLCVHMDDPRSETNFHNLIGPCS